MVSVNAGNASDATGSGFEVATGNGGVNVIVDVNSSIEMTSERGNRANAGSG